MPRENKIWIVYKPRDLQDPVWRLLDGADVYTDQEKHVDLLLESIGAHRFFLNRMQAEDALQLDDNREQGYVVIGGLDGHFDFKSQTKLRKRLVERLLAQENPPLANLDVGDDDDADAKRRSNRIFKRIVEQIANRIRSKPCKLYTQGYWEESPSGRSYEQYFYHNRLREIRKEETPSTKAEEYKKNMLEPDEKHGFLRADLFVGRTVEEIEDIIANLDGDTMWQHVWQLLYEEIFSEKFRLAHPKHREEFEKRRRTFIKTFTKRMWRLNDGRLLLHLRSESEGEFDEHERLSLGFIVVPAAFHRTFLTNERAAELWANDTESEYPWGEDEGDRALELIQKYSKKDESMTIAQLIEELQRQQEGEDEEEVQTRQRRPTKRKSSDDDDDVDDKLLSKRNKKVMKK